MNRISHLFGIRYPIIQGGMAWCSGWRLAAAVSQAGGLGLIGAGSMHPETLREHIRKCRQATSLPFGVNVPLMYPGTDCLHLRRKSEDVDRIPPRPRHQGGTRGIFLPFRRQM